MPASEDDSGCEVIDLTADDDNDRAHDAAELSCMQMQNSATPIQPADTAQAVEAAELAAANCSVGRPAEVSEAGTSSKLPDEATLAEVCMLDAYGMDLVAVISCMLQHFEDWPGTHTKICVCVCVCICVCVCVYMCVYGCLCGCALVSVLFVKTMAHHSKQTSCSWRQRCATNPCS